MQHSEYGHFSLSPRITIGIISASFLLGAVSGGVTALWASNSGSMHSYFSEFIEGARNGLLSSSFISLFAGFFVWPLIIFFSGFSICGIIAIPLCLAAKAYLISFSVSAFYVVFGTNGFLLALCGLGIVNLIYVPCLLLGALFGFRTSSIVVSTMIGGKSKPPKPLFGSPYFIQFAICSLVFAGLAAFQAFLQPELLSWLVMQI